MAIKSKIQQRLLQKMELAYFELKDFTGRHLNHKMHEGGFHLEAIIVSNAFIKKTLVQRHRLVYDAIGELMQKEIHALSMKTLTLDEWEKKKL
tara:strand:+ start:327 stop:605 length:279 start_codon:yes stop_codon:yes gene_type:complete